MDRLTSDLQMMCFFLVGIFCFDKNHPRSIPAGKKGNNSCFFFSLTIQVQEIAKGCKCAKTYVHLSGILKDAGCAVWMCRNLDMKPAVSAPRPEAPDFAEAMKELKVHMKTWMEDGKRVYGFVGSPSFTRNRCTNMSFLSVQYTIIYYAKKLGAKHIKNWMHPSNFTTVDCGVSLKSPQSH